ncbi:RNA pseudouridine synthase [Spirochaetia bacterium]|nr:RNA pseudouridine synthase [Spirochaetia bacterium]
MYPLQAHCNEPYVLSETEDYAVVYKPPLMHSVPLKKDEEENPLLNFPTLLDWYGRIEPRTLGLIGRKEIEGGLLHRLDYETEGLVLIAKNQSAMDALLAQQQQGLFVKEYGALSRLPENPDPLPGFPPFSQHTDPGIKRPEKIQSYFRPWGPGRKAVRPFVTGPDAPRRKITRTIASDQGNPYVTEILSSNDAGEGLTHFKLRIKRGFRHQIRCHLSWIGKPILNDALYGGAPLEKAQEAPDRRPPIALCAESFSFNDPASGERREYRIRQ